MTSVYGPIWYKKSETLNRLFLRNKTILTSVYGPMVHNIVKPFFIATISFENKSINMPHEALEIKLHFLISSFAAATVR